MNLVLQREILSDESTIGRLNVDGDFFCFTLEDMIRHGLKINAMTAIPSGKYQVVITPSNRFKKRLPLVKNVPGFDGIRIHAGNTSADTEGCILVGLTKGENFIGKSQMAMSLLMPKLEEALKEGDVWITIQNP